MCSLAPPPPLQPALSPPDIVALSFVPALPRARLFAILRGEASTTDTVERPGEVARPTCAIPDSLEGILDALGRQPTVELAGRARRDAAAAIERARRRCAEVLPCGDPRYPSLVSRIFDPPLVLWVRGSLDALSAPSIAVVGSRGASAYGEDAAARLSRDLAARGIVIVSGLARGIDAAAHRGALAAGGRTVAVLGCGVDVTYPPEHARLMDQVSRSGAVVSEFPPGSAPLRFNFPKRNRIISALSLGVVVIEARQRSGALITADSALEQGREVMAVPGNILSDRHRGSHALLKAGAALVETADDVLEVVALPVRGVTVRRGSSEGAGAGSTAPSGADSLLSVMEPGEGYALDALATISGESSAALLARLFQLELQGLVDRLPGGRFVRRGGNVLT